MRLSVIFLAVLAASVLLTSLAAWGITYGTSYSRVTTMSSEFTALSQETLSAFGSFVQALIQSNANLVNTILTEEQTSGKARMQQTKTDMITAIGTLVNYTTNATVQSQLQMNQVVDTFAGLMGTVVADFRGLTNSYSSQLRAALAEKVSSLLSGMGSTRTASLQRYPTLYVLGYLNLSQAWSDPIGQSDCMLLGALCASLQELGTGDQPTLALASGRYYICSSGGAGISVITQSGSTYDEDLLKWLPYNSSVPASAQKSILQRCLTEAPVVQRVGQSCPASQGCGVRCGADQRCASWYLVHANDTASRLKSLPFIDSVGVLYTSLSFSIPDLRSGAPVAVINDGIPLSVTDAIVNSISASPTTTIAVIASDAFFTLLALKGRKCAVNETLPGDPNLPSYSSFRSCDPGFRWLAQWVSQNLAAALKGVTIENNGTVWDTFLSSSRVSLFVIGTLLAEINGPIDASNAQATSQLTAVRTQSLGQVAASGDATRAYMAAVGQQNVLATQAMEASFLAQIEGLDTTSRAALAASQQSSSEQVQQLTAQQTAQITALKTTNLNAMSTATGWTLAVVFAILLAVMLCSAWGTVRLTRNLTDIIDVMEDVADMKVENLEVPQGSGVQEVARIQTAFRVLVLRLAEYKSYIPAGLFEQDEPEPTATARGEVAGLVAGSDGEDRSDRGSSRSLRNPALSAGRGARNSQSPRYSAIEVSAARNSVTSVASRRSIFVAPNRRSASKKNAAVLSVNVMGFVETLQASTETSTRALFNDYVTCVHEAASQGRGNVDCVLGDQVFVTFNAHIPCSDGPGAATTAALDMRQRLFQKAGDKLKFQIGISAGQVFASSVGYTRFKSMVTVGSPMKVASILSHLPRFGSGTVIIDAAIEERVKFVYKLSPVELVHLPDLKSLTNTAKKSQRVFMVFGKKAMQEDEWMYQIKENKDGNGLADWAQTFDRLVAATSPQDLQSSLQRFLADHPADETALRLRDRLPLWIPGFGIPL
eukprot:EG_transcript_676